MIKSAKFSFVRFEHPADNDYSLDIPFSLPVFGDHNIAFQFIVDDDRAIASGIKLGIADTAGALILAFPGPIDAVIKSYRYKLAGLAAYSSFDLDHISVGATTITYSLVGVTPAQLKDIFYDDWGIELIDDYFVLESNEAVEVVATVLAFPTTFSGVTPNFWHQGFVSVSGITNDQTDCFTYALLESDDTVIAYSNRFKPADEEAYTSLMIYSCNESNFEFVYDDATRNVIRLPFYLKQPQFPTTRTIDKKDTGRKTLLSAFVEKEYLIDTEQMPEVFHECMAMALVHDTVIIENKNTREVTLEVIETESYSPEWEVDQFAKAKGKIKVASYGYTNSNC